MVLVKFFDCLVVLYCRKIEIFMSKLFMSKIKKQCPICKMELKNNYLKAFGEKFYSQDCKEKYAQEVELPKQKGVGGCCH